MEQTNKNGFAIAGLVLGIIGVVIAFIPFINVLCYIMGILAFIFGLISLLKKTNRAMTIVAIILGILSIIITISINQKTVNVINNVFDDFKADVSNVTITDTNQNNNQKVENVKENAKIKVGQEVTTNDIKISFKSANDYTKYNSYFGPKSGNKIIRAEFTFENISSGDVYLNSFECYSDGEKCDWYYYADDMKNPVLEKLSSGKRMTAIVYFEVPKNAESIILEYETNSWTNNKVEFIVK